MLLFVGAAVAYRVVRDDESTVLALLVKAMNKATTGMFPKQQREVQTAANQLIQVAAKHRVQNATRNLLKTAVTNLIHTLGVDIDDNKLTIADQQVQDAAYLLIQKKVSKFSHDMECARDEQQTHPIEVSAQVKYAINDLVQELFQLIKKTIDQNQSEQQGEKILQAAATSIDQETDNEQLSSSVKVATLALLQATLLHILDIEKLVQEINSIKNQIDTVGGRKDLVQDEDTCTFLDEMWSKTDEQPEKCNPTSQCDTTLLRTLPLCTNRI